MNYARNSVCLFNEIILSDDNVYHFFLFSFALASGKVWFETKTKILFWKWFMRLLFSSLSTNFSFFLCLLLKSYFVFHILFHIFSSHDFYFSSHRISFFRAHSHFVFRNFNLKKLIYAYITASYLSFLNFTKQIKISQKYLMIYMNSNRLIYLTIKQC